MSRATILESGVVIHCESFELQPFKVDQLFRGVFKCSSNRNTEIKLLKTYLVREATVCEFGLFGG